MKIRPLTFSLAAVGLAAGAGSWADAPFNPIPVDPVPGVYYGWGYNLRTRQFTAPCVEYESGSIYPSGKSVEQKGYELAESTSEIAAVSNLSASMALKVVAGGGTYKANNKTSLVRNNKSSTYSQTLYARSSYYRVPRFVDVNTVRFKEAVRNLLTTPGGKGQFAQQCGDGFVAGIQMGREFIGTATVTRQSLKSWTEFASETNAEAAGAWGNVKGGLNIGEKMEQAFGTQNIAINVYSTGSTMPAPTKASELQEYYQKFLQTDGDEGVVKVFVMPYKMVADYPWESPLKTLTKDDYIGMMVVGLWDLKAAIADADFVIDPSTRNMFALGTNTHVKNRRLDFIRKQRRAWQQEYDKLLQTALKCDKSFDDRCKQVGLFYGNGYRALSEQWHAVMPERYLSDCYSPRTVDPTDPLKQALQSVNFGTPAKGDSETAGNPSRVVAKLAIFPDHRKLKARLSVAKIEWKRSKWRGEPIVVRSHKGESGWGLEAEALLFDLDGMKENAGGNNLRHCTWKGPGFRHRFVNTPPAADYFRRFDLQQRQVDGYIDGITGRHPRGQQMFGNGQGYLEYITCEVDRKGKDNFMHCSDVGVRSLPLQLVSTQDVEADRWRRPPEPRVPSILADFNAGKALRAAHYAAQFRAFKGMVPASRKKAVSDANRRRAASLKGLKAIRLNLPRSQLRLINQRLGTSTVKPMSRKGVSPATPSKEREKQPKRAHRVQPFPMLRLPMPPSK